MGLKEGDGANRQGVGIEDGMREVLCCVGSWEFLVKFLVGARGVHRGIARCRL